MILHSFRCLNLFSFVSVVCNIGQSAVIDDRQSLQFPYKTILRGRFRWRELTIVNARTRASNETDQDC